MYYMSIVSFRVNRDLKKRMDKLKHVNWSEVLRRYLIRVVEEEERRFSREKDFNRIKEASLTIDSLRSKSRSGWSGAAEIKKWRKLR